MLDNDLEWEGLIKEVGVGGGVLWIGWFAFERWASFKSKNSLALGVTIPPGSARRQGIKAPKIQNKKIR